MTTTTTDTGTDLAVIVSEPSDALVKRSQHWADLIGKGNFAAVAKLIGKPTAPDVQGIALAGRSAELSRVASANTVAVSVYVLTAVGEPQELIAQAIGVSQPRVSQLASEGRALVTLGTLPSDPKERAALVSSVRALVASNAQGLKRALSAKDPEAAVLRAGSKVIAARKASRAARITSEQAAANGDAKVKDASTGTPAPVQDPSTMPPSVLVQMCAAHHDGATWITANADKLTATARQAAREDAENLLAALSGKPSK